MNITEMKEIIKNWDCNQIRATHILLESGEVLDEVIEMINDYAFTFYDNLEEYILESLESAGGEVPTWVRIDVVGTYLATLKFDDNLMFVENIPKWTKKGSQYGTEEEKHIYREGIEYLCKYSEVLEVIR